MSCCSLEICKIAQEESLSLSNLHATRWALHYLGHLAVNINVDSSVQIKMTNLKKTQGLFSMKHN